MKQKKTQDTYNRFAFCHQNEALLYQFFLHECLLIFQKLHNEEPSEELLSQITGFESEKIASWRTSKGHLQKIHHYYTLMFTYFTDPNHAVIKKLGQSVEKAIISAENCLETILNNSEKKKSFYQQLKKEIKKIGSLLIEKLGDYQTNEHVLYFFLRKHDEFDLLYGEPIVAKTLTSLFPGGLDEAALFIAEKYSRKGFHHLVPTIEEYVSRLRT